MKKVLGIITPQGKTNYSHYEKHVHTNRMYEIERTHKDLEQLDPPSFLMGESTGTKL